MSDDVENGGLHQDLVIVAFIFAGVLAAAALGLFAGWLLWGG